ncbi:MAG: zinc dependent phospholipase C family protein [Lachnospiraceae bacterium]|nr:zinc dependent phospholipase C family protein [Lachnospiraceae bacterium]
MATWIMHLRIADRLLDELSESLAGRLDTEAFLIGSMAPDSGVPNADWSAYFPPKSVSHFKTKKNDESFFDIDRFVREYFRPESRREMTPRAYSFFLGYYIHLLTDEIWTEQIFGEARIRYPEAFANDRPALINRFKEDWYDLDFLYLEEHPDFRAFRLYEAAEGFVNDLMPIFSADAFEDRRRYICGFYHSDEHGELHRTYPYLTKAEADAFVENTGRRLTGALIDMEKENR